MADNDGAVGGGGCGPHGCVSLTRAEAEALWESAQEQKRERAVRLPDEPAAIRALFDAYQRLKELGWRDARYAPKEIPIQVIEVGSTGIHEASRDNEGRFWIHDTDTWPSRPALFRLPLPRKEAPDA